MLKIGICDDEQISRKQIKYICEQYMQKLYIDYKIIEANSGDELLNLNEKLDLVFLDIEMPGNDGIQIKNILFKQKINTKIIFVTNYAERMSEAFGPYVYAFLEKPVQLEAFNNALKTIIMELKENSIIVLYDLNNKKEYISLQNVSYIEGKQNYTRVLLNTEKTFIVRKNMYKWENELINKDFCRVHNSFIVNFAHVKKIMGEKLIMDNDEIIPVSRRREKEVFVRYDEFLLRAAR